MNFCALRPCFIDHFFLTSDFRQVPRRNLFSICAKCGLSRNDELYVYCACGHQMMRRLHAWMVCKHSFCLTGHRRLSGMECVNESHECPLKLCRVTFLRAQRASFFQTVPQPTRCMSHVLQHVERHEDELDWNSTSV